MLFCVLLALAATQPPTATATASTPGTSTDSTVVVQGQADQDIGRDFVAGKIIIDRKRLADSGKHSVGDVLRSEPAISVGKDGRLGLLGLPGYTQVLVDGQPAQGVDPFALDLVHVERIEILKSATAVSGPFGIAGTINIVRRKTERTSSTRLQLGASHLGDRSGGNASLSDNQAPAEATVFSYNLSLSASHRPGPTDSAYTQTLRRDPAAPQEQLRGTRQGNSATESFLAIAELAWQLNASHKISVRPDLGHFTSIQDRNEERRWVDGQRSIYTLQTQTPLNSGGLPVRWDWQLESGARLAVQWNANWLRVDTAALSTEQESAAAQHVRRHTDHSAGANQFLNVDISHDLAGGHALQAGAKLSHNRSSKAYADWIDGAPDTSLVTQGAGNSVTRSTVSLFLQDDWRVNRTLALSGGLSAERHNQLLDEQFVQNQANFAIWSPSLNVSKKLSSDGKRLLRASLARTFKAPEPDQLLLHPRIHPLSPCPSLRLCGSNTIDAADGSGNPHLQPERALGLNLSYTDAIGKGSEFTVEFYAREFANKIGSALALESVAWASAPRYVVRPANLGSASVRGLNLEGRLALRDVWPAAPPLNMLGSIGVARSVVSSVPSPDNHIEGQLPWRAKLAANYAAASLPLKLGVDAQWLAADSIRTNATERTDQPHRLTLNANANWKINATTSLAFTADNLFAARAVRIDSYQGVGEVLERRTTSSSHARLAARLELSL